MGLPGADQIFRELSSTTVVSSVTHPKCSTSAARLSRPETGIRSATQKRGLLQALSYCEPPSIESAKKAAFFARTQISTYN